MKTLQLAPGEHRLANLTDTVIDGAEVSKIKLVGCRNVRVENLRLQLVATASTVTHVNAVEIDQCEGVTFSGGNITGACRPGETKPIGRGMMINRSRGITVEDLSIDGVGKGIVLSRVEDLILRRLDIGHFTQSGVVGGVELINLLMEGCRIHDSADVIGDAVHADLFHIWSAPTNTLVGAVRPSSNIVLRGNLLDMGQGTPIIAILIDDNRTGIGFDNFRAEDNVIISAHPVAVGLENVRSGALLRNLLLQGAPTDRRSAPDFTLDRCGVLDVRGNTAADRHGAFTLYPDNVTLPEGVRPAEELEAARKAWAEKWRGPPEPPPPLTLEDRVAALEARVARLEAR
ncbi:right-handed parallel beta-helix repeat-containing protein [Phenylobacterium kunshanense]|uniref:Uncharacterized protein n=1 Tax=Phenylobacterium kunshanense TaxID=1445034 RepID=A0A328BN73_9CAUL|nr:right-handed parallel beta-helix repeat-containing protein [Phenylobacterium kunshanense]RAK68832.1 hypothetical protein DJ019_02115 [Phenylobacterium kunshanense]